MCSINDVDEGCENLEVSEKHSFNRNTTCRSCPERGCLVLRKKDVYCKNCFLSTETHKFRAALGRSKMMKPTDRVLVAHSGSQSSTALLHLLHSGVNEEQHKKLMFSIFVLFIDESALFDVAAEQREKFINTVKESVLCYNFPFYTCSLSECLYDSVTLESSLKFDVKHDKQLLDLFLNVKSMSSKEDLLYLLRKKLIIKAAEQLNCNKVFTAEVGTDLAIKLLGRFCLGRGDQAAFDTGFCDSRLPHIKILRPLRDFTKKEIVFYNKFQNLEGIISPSLTTKSPVNTSIQKLTETFVTDLQEGFPSTVYTIFRTAEKLSSKNAGKDTNDNLCALCKSKITTKKQKSDYTAVDAANFSTNVSRKKINNCVVESKGNCCGSCSGGKKPEIDLPEIEKYLCYGCISIMRDMKNVNSLPKDLIQPVILRKNIEEMKEQISDYLIGDASDLEV